MERKFLEGLGLEKEVIDKIMAEHGNTVNTTKQELDSVTTDRDNLKTQLKDRDKQLNELKDVDPEALKERITTLETENKTQKEDYEKQLKDKTVTNAIKLSLAGQVHDEDLAVSLIDKEKLVIDGDKIVGLDEQVETLKESKAFLFKSDEVVENGKPTFTTGQHGSNSGSSKMTKEEIMKVADSKERQRLIRENSKLFR